MGISSSKSIYARYRNGSDRVNGRRQAPSHLRIRRAQWAVASLIAALLFHGPIWAETIRIATFNTELERRGPGLLLRDITSGKDEQVAAVIAIINHTDPDIVLLTSFDYDAQNIALTTFSNSLAAPYPYHFSVRPNTGMATGIDLNGDGKIGTARDAQGYGKFSGQGGMAILSRHPIDADAVINFSSMRWADFPNAMLPQKNGTPFLSPEALAVQRLSTTAHWVVPVNVMDNDILLFAYHATPPVFDGPEDKNGKRNHDETRFWSAYLEGELAQKPLNLPFVILGDANLDPHDGDGLHTTMTSLLNRPDVQDTAPESTGAASAARSQGGVNDTHQGNSATDTVDWNDKNGPGNMRVDYVLPSAKFKVSGSGVFWPAPTDSDARILGAQANTASRHRLVWVDLELDGL